MIIICAVIDADASYWSDPAVFLQVPSDYSEYGGYFVLHDFASTQPINYITLPNLKISGVLKYKVKCNSSDIFG